MSNVQNASVIPSAEAVKCSNFLRPVFSCVFCTEAIEMPGANTFRVGGRAPKTTFCTVICILQFSLISEYFSTLG